MSSPIPPAATDEPVNVTYTINVPADFTGTEAERVANYRSHAWTTYRLDENDAETVCGRCDTKPYHKHADYPCGDEAPRVDVPVTRSVPADEAAWWSGRRIPSGS